ncbi:helix-turn-helix domain-containing protein [Thalassomonas haliotis]|uniref:AraC family transcriptional regulator n=1 Tax=Thalassomonas haliotis TaxID=485448 RepID=A0ABY7VDR4_9GAMM|nr:helix-turn-helix domain-containing protein [Thalassomonas haliotis]WDE11481.1 AraC family transcriptional regulator [Thalassomonas haliotis]
MKEIKIFERLLPVSRQKSGRVVVLHDIFITPTETKTAKKTIFGQSATAPDSRLYNTAKSPPGTSIIEIAGKLGFADQSHFHRHFQKRIALPPKQYQKLFNPV